MLQIIKNKKVIGLIVAIIGLLLVFVFQVSGGATDENIDNESESTENTIVTEYVVNGGNTSSEISTSGTVESFSQASLTAEGAGSVQYIAVRTGDTVNRGGILVRLSADDQLAALAQAEAGLQLQQARLNELRSGVRPAELRNTEIALADARQTFFNTDLQAYVADTNISTNYGSYAAPEVSGVYSAEEQGSYLISLYRSGNDSGYSFRYTGLETGVSPVNTEIPQQLGERGLYIQFPENFATNRDLKWVVPIPNTRSSQYNQAQSNFQRAQNNLELAQEGARFEQIQAQEATVAQSESGVVAAQAQLSKKIIRAPFSGEITAVHVNTGEFVSPGQITVEIVDVDNLQVSAFISSADAGRVEVGDTALLDGMYEGRVVAVSSAVNSQTGKIEVTIEVTDQTARLIVGDFIPVQIEVSGNGMSGTSVPLTAVKNDTNGAYVLEINSDNKTQRVDVVTGAVQGDSVVVTQGLTDVDSIIRDARSIRVGVEVTVN